MPTVCAQSISGAATFVYQSKHGKDTIFEAAVCIFMAVFHSISALIICIMLLNFVDRLFNDSVIFFMSRH